MAAPIANASAYASLFCALTAALVVRNAGNYDETADEHRITLTLTAIGVRRLRGKRQVYSS